VGDENRRGLGNQALFDREDVYCREEAVLENRVSRERRIKLRDEKRISGAVVQDGQIFWHISW